MLILGHGTATGVEAADLQALARALPRAGITVVLVTQPYRVERDRRLADERSLDTAWTAIWPSATTPGVPAIAGGRSAGSQVACRTAHQLGARAVLALAYPLLGPGSSEELLSTGPPTLVIQGGSDPFGRPEQFPRSRPASNSSLSRVRTTCLPRAAFAAARTRSRKSPMPRPNGSTDSSTSGMAGWHEGE
jgi:predicted alpha/beta-hydrolase family hydrolase